MGSLLFTSSLRLASGDMAPPADSDSFVLVTLSFLLPKNLPSDDLMPFFFCCSADLEEADDVDVFWCASIDSELFDVIDGREYSGPDGANES